MHGDCHTIHSDGARGAGSARGLCCLLRGEDGWVAMMVIDGARALVVGLGDTGLSLVRWLKAQGAILTVSDTRSEPPALSALRALHDDVVVHTGGLEEFGRLEIDLIAVSPGVDRRRGPLAEAAGRGIPVVGDIELFAQSLNAVGDARPPVIAITGSNGKSTVTALCGEICLAAGKRPLVAGNIGLPVLDAWSSVTTSGTMPDTVVLELSSFQLESTSSLDADAATVLNLCEDHLDRYDSMDEYAAAKARIFAGRGCQVLNREDTRSRSMALPGRDVRAFGTMAPASDRDWGLLGEAGSMLGVGAQALLPRTDLPLTGLHNVANALAAGALCAAIGIGHTAIISGWQRFGGLPHRSKLINKINDIEFYDDSKGTNVGATVAALAGMQQPVVLIAGGDGKGQDFSPLKAAVMTGARAVVLIGRDASMIAKAIGATVPQVCAADMQEAVRSAFELARAGDAVLLSPACASYDMFRSYVHRGEVFADCVAALAAAQARTGGAV